MKNNDKTDCDSDIRFDRKWDTSKLVLILTSQDDVSIDCRCRFMFLPLI